jgi:hypothetical protein
VLVAGCGHLHLRMNSLSVYSSSQHSPTKETETS